eukprot:CAMPEP_0206507680 /NCGR_PEP_ID=MMETSP0324_2-20121206/57707_1 /ASSEMBLY_ACC=CAM_ASM_000836 /TAXON_ID=2866 /ORGANISM="Crypthecodinium cohnii, Strain Seligo" /LENGTH=112 /DNA_ID=CAMNT_0053998051 /DNA_START=892 /DNA_END=1230 /DNA_ORIENTATION=+
MFWTTEGAASTLFGAAELEVCAVARVVLTLNLRSIVLLHKAIGTIEEGAHAFVRTALVAIFLLRAAGIRAQVLLVVGSKNLGARAGIGIADDLRFATGGVIDPLLALEAVAI